MTDTATILLLSTLTLIAICVPLVLAYRLWRRWEVVRRERLHWAIVHTRLLTALIIVALIALWEGLNGLNNFRTMLPPDASPLLATLTLLVPTLFWLDPRHPAAHWHYGTYRVYRAPHRCPNHSAYRSIGRDNGRFARRELCGTQSGRGADRTATVQVGFNDMAAELETTLQALQRERNTMLRLLETRRELFAEVSHELRTPAATLRGYLNSALTSWDTEPPATLHHDLEIMSHETDRLKRLIDDLFLLARAEVGKLALTIAETDVGALASLVVQTVAPLAWERGRVRVAADIADNLPKALADGARLEQILQNLLHNAIRHTPPGGIVVVHAAADPSTQTLRFEVRDTARHRAG